ncbi:hypothetical protein [Rhizobium sp. JAB6]|uniref:hypothetical protein n=1 Tax=Rhizobium sp. JAB6 TaxID=2127050 RepID=UPI001FE0F4A4|nr:hypothetical protein [Rhizobium sp. JAB6]
MDHQRCALSQIGNDRRIELEPDTAIFVPSGIDDRLFDLVARQDHQIAVGVGDSDLRFVGKAIWDQITLDNMAMIVFEVKKHGFSPSLLSVGDRAEIGDGAASFSSA